MPDEDKTFNGSLVLKASHAHTVYMALYRHLFMHFSCLALNVDVSMHSPQG